MFGMQHNIGPYSWNQPPTMAPNIAGGLKSRSLEEDDILGVCFLYPKVQPWSCTSDEECPMILDQDQDGDDFYAGSYQCGSDGTCSTLDLYPENTSQLGEECTTDASCVDDLYCQPWLDSAICTGYCQPANDNCPDEFYCEPFVSYPSTGPVFPRTERSRSPGQTAVSPPRSAPVACSACRCPMSRRRSAQSCARSGTTRPALTARSASPTET